MTSWAKPGAKCVCIDDGWIVDDLCTVLAPAKGQIVEVNRIGEFMGRICLGFVGFGTHGYLIESFKPLVEQADDVALFAHHLDQVGEPA